MSEAAEPLQEPVTDPGWGGFTGVLLGLVPLMGPRRARGVDPLILGRRVFLTFCVSLVLYGIVLSVMDFGRSEAADLSTSAAVAIVAVFGVVALGVGRRVADRPLDCESAQVLSSSYRTRLFMRIAFSEAPALLGFVLVFFAHSLWPYVIGAMFAAVGLAWGAPTKGHIAHDQRLLRASGCTCDLLAVLRGLAPPTEAEAG